MDHSSITKAELDAAIAPLATKAELQAAFAPLATKAELQAAIAPLATKVELRAAIAPLATKAELQTAINELGDTITRVSTELREFISETAHDSQTELLRGMEVFLKGAEMRVHRLEISSKTHDAYDSALNDRILTIEARVLEIEKKLLLRP